jgi:serine/threonine protein kinase
METIGKYEIVRRMGTGPLGEIYEARDPATGARCVIKTCSVDDQALRERFLAAAKATRSLLHPAIVTVLDAGLEAGKPFLAEEFLSGEALDRRLERGAPLPTEQSVGVLFQVSQALAAAAALGIVHRDLRLANVRLLSDGRAKVQGFGVAELARTAAVQSRVGEAPVETAFVSPEQIRGEEPDARSDQFAFGVMAYELLSGRRPFGGEHAADFMVQVLSTEPISLSDRSPDCPPELARIVARCMEKEPARRFAETAQLVAAMSPLVDVVSEGPRQVTRVLEASELKPDSPSPEAKRSEARARIAQHFEGIRERLRMSRSAISSSSASTGAGATDLTAK